MFDLGRTAAGAPFIVMELLVGKSLATLVVEGALGVSVVLDLALEVSSALTEAHARGIIHRDLKPANVFVVIDAEGRRHAKVLDFGIAKFEGSAIGDKSLTTSGSMIGTPWYMPPEQLDTRQGVTPKADVWSLGATMYNALTGRTPYEAESFFELSVKVYAHEPTPIDRHRSDLPPDVVAFVHACLQKDVGRRLALPEVIERLEELCAAHRGLDAPPPPRPATAPSTAFASASEATTMALARTQRMPRSEPPPRSIDAPLPAARSRGRTALTIALVAGVVLAGTALVARFRYSGPTAVGAPSAEPPPVVASAPPEPPPPTAPVPSPPLPIASAALSAPPPPRATPRRTPPRASASVKPEPSSANSGALTHER